eukprot:1779301-Pyramimonas_sp.AAC.1
MTADRLQAGGYYQWCNTFYADTVCDAHISTSARWDGGPAKLQVCSGLVGQTMPACLLKVEQMHV